MAVQVWLVRNTDPKFNGGRLGWAEVEEDLGKSLVKKGDALAEGDDLFHRWHAWDLAEQERHRQANAPQAEAEGVQVGADKEGGRDDPEAPKRRGRPPKAKADNGDDE